DSYFSPVTVRPEVKVSSRPSGSAMKLHCQVYGFYPRDVDVNWMKNGMDYIPSDEAKQILPNSDGTYQLRASVEVTPEDGASYSCHVDHSSLDEPLSVTWRKPL
uniref:Ig-like domain-containing protein n=1 Tax=Leptobrachium leishanense TaxID=445787 RepID=A0A8C5QJX8_9ANUR